MIRPSLDLSWQGKLNKLDARGGDDDAKDRGVIYLGHIPFGFFEEEMRGFFSQAASHVDSAVMPPSTCAVPSIFAMVSAPPVPCLCSLVK